jgi:hypothetical protein
MTLQILRVLISYKRRDVKMARSVFSIIRFIVQLTTLVCFEIYLLTTITNRKETQDKINKL